MLLWCREENPGQQLKDDLTYIKKPPNAFMLFLEEQRPLVAPELRRQGTSKVNKALGKKVRLEKLLTLFLTQLVKLICASASVNANSTGEISQSCNVLVFAGCVCITHDMCAAAPPTVEVAYSAGESQILPPGQDKSATSQTAVPWLEQ